MAKKEKKPKEKPEPKNLDSAHLPFREFNFGNIIVATDYDFDF